MRALRTLLPVALIGVIGLGAIVTGPTGPVSAAAGGKVVICHRTHSTTNPYRRITVSISAVNGSSTNDHTHHTGSVFDPLFAYPANAKNWGDIIPDSASGGSGSGLNWAAGSATYNSARCGAMSAQQFYDTEYAAGVPVADILADLDEQKADEDATLLRQIGSFSNPTGTNAAFTASTTTIVTTTTAAPETTVAPTSTDAPTTTAAPDTTTTDAPATTASSSSSTTTPPATEPPATSSAPTDPPTTVAGTTTTTTTTGPDTTTTGPDTTTTVPDATTTTVTVAPSSNPSTSTSVTSTTVTSVPDTSAPTTTVAVTTTTTATATGARVVGIAWFDANRNGVMDGTERPLPGVPVQLQPTDRALSRTQNVVRSGVTVTRSDGSFRFTRVQPGEYTVVGSLDAAGIGRIWDTDGAADWHVHVLVPAGGVGRADMAAVGDGTLRGIVLRSGDESPVAGADVSCTWAGLDEAFEGGDDSTFPAATSTDGTFMIDGVPFGQFRCAAEDHSTGTRSDIGATEVTADAGRVTLHIPTEAVGATNGSLPRTGADQWPLLMMGLLFILGGIACGVGVREF